MGAGQAIGRWLYWASVGVAVAVPSTSPAAKACWPASLFSASAVKPVIVTVPLTDAPLRVRPLIRAIRTLFSRITIVQWTWRRCGPVAWHLRCTRRRASANTDTPDLVEMTVGRRRSIVRVPPESATPPRTTMNPRSVLALTLPPEIGNVKVVPDAVAGASAVTVMWLAASACAAPVEAVIVVVPPVTLAAPAALAKTSDATVTIMATIRIRDMSLLWVI